MDILFGANIKLPGHMTETVSTKFNLENVCNAQDNQISSNQAWEMLMEDVFWSNKIVENIIQEEFVILVQQDTSFTMVNASQIIASLFHLLAITALLVLHCLLIKQVFALTKFKQTVSFMIK